MDRDALSILGLSSSLLQGPMLELLLCGLVLTTPNSKIGLFLQ
jgi:hypothetical protein